MENVMTNGFCELNENEMMAVEGGYTETNNPIVNFINGTKNYIIIARNAISNALKPSTDNDNGYIWTMY